MNKFFTVFAVIAILFSSVVLAEGRQQPGSQGTYLGGADGRFFGKYITAPSITGYVVDLSVTKKVEDETKNLQAKVVSGEKLLKVGSSVTNKNGINVVYQSSEDNVVLTVTVPKSNLNSYMSMNFGSSFNLLFKEGKLVLPNAKDFTIESKPVAKQDSIKEDSNKQNSN